MIKKNEKLDKLLKEMERKYSVHKASEIEVEPKIRTGLYALDYVLDGGISQYSGGHIMEFYGGESSGKTTFALHIIKKYLSFLDPGIAIHQVPATLS